MSGYNDTLTIDMPSNSENTDVAIVGGGFYGCAAALAMREAGLQVVLFEKEAELMQRASYVNQARIHQGYHYPRSLLTALRSRVNFDRFTREYEDCVYSSFEHYYAIGRISTKISAAQFSLFCSRIGAPLEKAPADIKAMFNPDLVEDVFRVREYAFDADSLRDIMRRAMEAAGVDIRTAARVEAVTASGDRMQVDYASDSGGGRLHCGYVLNCTYSRINQLVKASGLPAIPLKHEMTEMALVEVPGALENLAVTVMDGPFFSLMPFPARKLHSLSHVRYTPHNCWQDTDATRAGHMPDRLDDTLPSYHIHMLKDAQRYLPVVGDCRYIESLWEVKTVLPQSETDDSRPILFSRNPALPNLISIMGGKIDNIFDIREKLGMLFQKGHELQ